MKKIVVVSDLQVPFHDIKATQVLAKFIKYFKPDEVILIGDEIDFNTISKWSRGTAEEYETTIGQDRDTCVDLLWELTRHAPVANMVRSNHTDRLFNSLATRLPALRELEELRFERFMRLDELGIKFHRQPYEISGTNWIAIHGDEQGTTPNAGATALRAARQHGKSVVQGHTHRLGIMTYTESSGYKVGRTLYGMEVGNLMQFSSAKYTKGTANWTQGFGILRIEGSKVSPQIVPIERDGSFIVDGKLFS
jgi:predicted phosphodiesterase